MPILSEYEFRDLTDDTVQAGIEDGSVLDLFGQNRVKALQFAAVYDHVPLMQYLLALPDFDTDMINEHRDESECVIEEGNLSYEEMIDWPVCIAQQAVICNSTKVLGMLLDDHRFSLVPPPEEDQFPILEFVLRADISEGIPRQANDEVLRMMLSHPRLIQCMPPYADGNLLHSICQCLNFRALQIAEEELQPEFIAHLLHMTNVDGETPAQVLWQAVSNHLWRETDDVVPEPFFTEDLVPLVRRILELDPASRSCQAAGYANVFHLLSRYIETFGNDEWIQWFSDLVHAPPAPMIAIEE